MGRKGPTKAERRRALAAFLPPDVCDALNEQTNPQQAATRSPTRPDDLQHLGDRSAAANAVGDEAARHPAEGRE